MKKTATLICIVLSLVLILDSVDLGHSLAMLLLAGVVPGTNIILDANYMLVISASLIGFILGRISMHFIITMHRRAGQYSQPKAATPAV